MKSFTLQKAAKKSNRSVQELEDAINSGDLLAYEELGTWWIYEEDLQFWLEYGGQDFSDQEITLLSAAEVAGVSPKLLMIEVIQKRLKARTRKRHWMRWLISFRNLTKWRDEMKAKGWDLM